MSKVEVRPPFYEFFVEGIQGELGFQNIIGRLSAESGLTLKEAEEAVSNCHEFALKKNPGDVTTFLGYRDYVIARHGEIGEKRVGLWQIVKVRGKKRLYLRCKACKAINDITHYRITYQGYTARTRCITCVGCRLHAWYKLDGWMEKGR